MYYMQRVELRIVGFVQTANFGLGAAGSAGPAPTPSILQNIDEYSIVHFITEYRVANCL